MLLLTWYDNIIKEHPLKVHVASADTLADVVNDAGATEALQSWSKEHLWTLESLFTQQHMLAVWEIVANPAVTTTPLDG